MAQQENRVLNVLFRGVDAGLSAASQGASSAIGGIQSAAQTGAGGMAALADRVLMAESAFLAIGATITGVAIKAAQDFNTEVGALNRVLPETVEFSGEVEASLRSMAAEYGVTAADAVGSLKEIVQAGWSLEDAMQLLDSTLKLSAGSDGLLDVAQSTDVVKRSLAGMRAEADAVTPILDKLNIASTVAGTDIKQAALAFSDFSPNIKQYGLSVDEAVAATTSIIEVFGSGSEAANALKSGLAQLVAPAGATEDALAELSDKFPILQLRDMNGENLRAFDIYKQLLEIWPKLSDAEQSRYGRMLYGIEQMGRLSAATGGYEKVLKNLTAETSKNFTLAAEWEAKSQTLAIAMKRLTASVTDLGEAYGSGLLPNFSQVINASNEFVREFIASLGRGRLDPVLDALNSFQSEVAQWIRGITKNLDEALQGVDFSGLITSIENIFDALRSTMQAFTGTLDLSTVEGLQKAIQAVVDTFAGLGNTTAGIIEAYEPLARTFGQLASSAREGSQASQTFFGQLLGGAKIVQDFGVVLGGLAVSFGRTGLTWEEAWTRSQLAVQRLILDFRMGYAEMVREVAGRSADLVQSLSGLPWGMGEGLGQLAESMRALGNDSVASLRDADKALINQTNLWEDSVRSRREALDRLDQGLSGVAESSMRAGQTMAQSFSPVTSALSQTSQALDQLSDAQQDMAENSFGFQAQLAEFSTASKQSVQEWYDLLVDAETDLARRQDLTGRYQAILADTSGAYSPAQKASVQESLTASRLDETKISQEIAEYQKILSQEMKDLKRQGIIAQAPNISIDGGTIDIATKQMMDAIFQEWNKQLSEAGAESINGQ
jgi:TP901 family phage tail tape measure protein